MIVLLLQIVAFVFLARAILSWFRLTPGSALYPVQRLVFQVTEPVLAPIRQLLPKTGGFDFSVFIVLAIISFVLIPLAS